MANGTVLVIEDDVDIREALRQLLELEGYEALTATQGKEGLDVLASKRPCVILLDLMMPVMNGWDFIEIVKAHPEYHSIPVVVVSAAGERRKVTQAEAFLKKPIDLDLLIDVVRKFCTI